MFVNLLAMEEAKTASFRGVSTYFWPGSIFQKEYLVCYSIGRQIFCDILHVYILYSYKNNNYI